MPPRTLLALSGRNIGRSRVRSGVVMASVVLAAWCGTFVLAFYNGFSQQYVRQQLSTFIPHILLETAAFYEDPVPEAMLPNPEALLREIEQTGFVAGSSARIRLTGLAASASSSYGTILLGVDPERERTVSALEAYLVAGTWFSGTTRNPVVVGQQLATRLNVQERSRIVVTFQRTDGTLTSASFRVAGIVDAPMSMYNDGLVIARRSDVASLAGSDAMVHEIALALPEYSTADSAAAQIRTLIADSTIRVSAWGERSPELRYLGEVTTTSMYVIMAIFILALCFGIVNTMLMAVLERTPELGMLRAIGMTRRQAFAMILTETLLLSLAGAPLGLLLGYLTNTALADRGLNLSAFSEGLSAYGMGSVVYPELPLLHYAGIGALIAIGAMLAALIPARKALQIVPLPATLTT